MPGNYRIRVRTADGGKRSYVQVKDALGRDLYVKQDGKEFIICADTEECLARVKKGLRAAGLTEITGGATHFTEQTAAAPAPARIQQSPRAQNTPARAAAPQDHVTDLSSIRKPYSFVPLPPPDEFSLEEPVWHDGTCSAGRLSGEIRLDLKNLTPLLVGWERQTVEDSESPWRIQHNPVDANTFERVLQQAAIQADEKTHETRKRLTGKVVSTPLASGPVNKQKAALCPLRAPWAPGPVVLPGDSLKGLLRHELGALVGAPMERAAERTYSYRPNSRYPDRPNPYLIPCPARVPENSVKMHDLDGFEVRVPVQLEIFLPVWDGNRLPNVRNNPASWYTFNGGSAYRGGLGAGQWLNSKKALHSSVDITSYATKPCEPVPDEVQQTYKNTLRHLLDTEKGHFSARHPDVASKKIRSEDAHDRILEAARKEVFQPGDIVWVEWDVKKEKIVSVGWHYYYRWAYQDTVRRLNWNQDRPELVPQACEKGDDPKKLTAVRRLFGYVGGASSSDNEGSAGIGKEDFSQLMGRISMNAALEEVQPGATDQQRFLGPTFLKELGMPRPSAVEFYLQQPHNPNRRPTDRATLVTYGDAKNFDRGGKLAGRKFYLDRSNANAAEDNEANRMNDRSTLALEASKPDRTFRFTLRFRDLDSKELVAILLALCPNQLRDTIGGKHPAGYCSKLGYARPLGWGSVQIEAKSLWFLDREKEMPALKDQGEVGVWFRSHFQAKEFPALDKWLDVHCRSHPKAGDYYRKNSTDPIYKFHSDMRSEHSLLRRYF